MFFDGGEINASGIYVMRQGWTKGERFYYRFGARPNHGLMYVLSGEVEYGFDGGKITVEAGRVVYLPLNKKYTAAFKKNTADVLINFETPSALNAEIALFDPPNGEKVKELFCNAANCGTSFEFKLKSLFYAILSELCEKSEEDGFSAAIARLSETDELFGLTEAELSRRFALSVSSFQRRFKDKFGTTFGGYKSAERLEKAKRYLSFMSVGEIADRLGFYDRSHFDKFFTAAAGVSPSEYVESIRKA